MHRVISAEFSRRSFYVSLRGFEAFGELRSQDWPRQWSGLREPDLLELWFGRAYLCLSRLRRTSADPAPAAPETGGSEPKQCQVLAFKGPVRAA